MRRGGDAAPQAGGVAENPVRGTWGAAFDRAAAAYRDAAVRARDHALLALANREDAERFGRETEEWEGAAVISGAITGRNEAERKASLNALCATSEEYIAARQGRDLALHAARAAEIQERLALHEVSLHKRTLDWLVATMRGGI